MSGPNGCGKSTLTRMSGFVGIEIIDPDAVARSMASGSPACAAREALRRRRDAMRAGRSHLVETTLAGSGIFRHMSAATPEQALDRIRNRVALGGHDVPEVDARQRFARSQVNLPTAIARADEAVLYDNTDLDRPHREVALLNDGARWIAEAVPDWAAEALARI